MRDTVEPPLPVEELTKLVATSTPGRWVWAGHSGSKEHGSSPNRTSIHLGSWVPGRGLCTVMDTVKTGFDRAQPAFSGWNAGTDWPDPIVEARELAVHEVGYRDDIIDIAHPNAKLIVHARRLAMRVIELERRLATLEAHNAARP